MSKEVTPPRPLRAAQQHRYGGPHTLTYLLTRLRLARALQLLLVLELPPPRVLGVVGDLRAQLCDVALQLRARGDGLLGEGLGLGFGFGFGFGFEFGLGFGLGWARVS